MNRQHLLYCSTSYTLKDTVGPLQFLHGLPMKARNTAPLGYELQLCSPQFHHLYWLRFHCCSRVRQTNVWQSNLNWRVNKDICLSKTRLQIVVNNVGKVLVHNCTTCGMPCGWIKVSLHVTFTTLTLLAVFLTLCSLVSSSLGTDLCMMSHKDSTNKQDSRVVSYFVVWTSRTARTSCQIWSHSNMGLGADPLVFCAVHK